jgi:hypothetical protein
MSVCIIQELPENYECLVDLNDKSKLYQKDDSYICSLIVPWFVCISHKLYIQIDATPEQLAKRICQPLGFSMKEFPIFSSFLTNLCDSINDGLDFDDTYINKMKIEQVSMPFWALQAVMYITKNRKNQTSESAKKINLLFALAQMIYVYFAEIQRQIIAEL